VTGVTSYSVPGNIHCTVMCTTCQLSHPSRSLIWMQNVTTVKFSHVNIIQLLYTILISTLHYTVNDNAGLIYTIPCTQQSCESHRVLAGARSRKAIQTLIYLEGHHNNWWQTFSQEYDDDDTHFMYNGPLMSHDLLPQTCSPIYHKFENRWQ
jgi:hypothetical protein